MNGSGYIKGGKINMNLSITKVKSNVENINAYLLIAFAFILPLSVAIANIIGAFIIIFWLLRGSFKSDWNELKTNKVILAVLAFYLLHIIGLLWTEDMQWGVHILKKETKFLLLPIFMLFVKKEHIKYYIYAFLTAITISELLSYSIWFEIIEPFKYAMANNPTPLMSHISYNPFLAFAIYLLLNRLVFDKTIDNKQKLLYSFFIITMSINMFITGGRAGQVMYFAMLIILVFQYFNTQKAKYNEKTKVMESLTKYISYMGENRATGSYLKYNNETGISMSKNVTVNYKLKERNQ